MGCATAGRPDYPQGGDEHADRAEVATARSTLADTMPDVRSAEPTVAVNCAGRNHLLLIATEATPAIEEPARFLQRRWNVGQPRSACRRRTATPGLTVLTRPDGDRVDAGMYHADGTAAYAGTGTFANGGRGHIGGDRRKTGAVAVRFHVAVAGGRVGLTIDSETTPRTARRLPSPFTR